MRTTAIALAALGMLTLAAPAVQAGVTCKMIPSMCPALGGRDHGHGDQGHSTPEPGTLGLLALGAAAAGYAKLRRKKQ